MFGRVKKLLPTWTGRTGIVYVYGVGSGLLNRGSKYIGVAEVREVERAGDMSKLYVVKVTGVDESDAEQLKELVPEWMQSSEVKWIKDSA